MMWRGLAIIALSGVFVAGCVSPATLKQTQAELDDARAQLVEEQRRAAGEQEQLSARIETLEEEKTSLANELLAAQTDTTQSRSRLNAVRQSLEDEQQARRESERQLARIQDDHQQTLRLSDELRRERDQERGRADDLQRQLTTVSAELEDRAQALTLAEERIAKLDAGKAGVEAELANTRNQMRDVTIQLAAERDNVARISEEKQRLMTGTTTAQEEIARLQNRVGELEAVAARASDLEQRLSERDQEIGRLREAAADRGSLAVKVDSLADELNNVKQRAASLTAELATLTEAADRVRQERDRYAQEVSRLEQEAGAKAAEIQRLTQTQEALNKSLRAEIAKGDIRIKQVRDKLTINMVDRILFDSGRAELKSNGLEVLKRVSDVLKTIADKQIRIEGHTDNVPIGVKLRERFPTNWELSTARATSVVRYLVDHGGVDPEKLTAAGHADTIPVADNESEEGRQANRRIEIVLYPSDLPGLIEKVQS